MSLSTKKRAQEFADLLERDARTDDPDLAPLVALGTALRSASTVDGPSPEFRTALRQRLVAVATVQGVGETASVSTRVRESAGAWRVQRRIALVAGGAAAVTAVAGVSVGASRSLPGDAFYGLKRASESVQLAAAQGDEAKGKKHLDFARARLSEVRALAGRGEALPTLVPGQPVAAALPQSSDSGTITDTLRAMDSETRAGAEDLFLAYQHSGSTEPLTTLHAFTQKQYAELMALLPALPTDVQAPAKRSLALLRIVANDTVKLARPAGAQTSTGGSASRSPSPAPTRTSGSTGRPKPTPSTVTSSPSSGGTRQTPGGVTSVPSVPTIPPVPTVGPLPTDLPTTLPPMPDLGSALPIGG